MRNKLNKVTSLQKGFISKACIFSTSYILLTGEITCFAPPPEIIKEKNKLHGLVKNDGKVYQNETLKQEKADQLATKSIPGNKAKSKDQTNKTPTPLSSQKTAPITNQTVVETRRISKEKAGHNLTLLNSSKPTPIINQSIAENQQSNKSQADQNLILPNNKEKDVIEQKTIVETAKDPIEQKKVVETTEINKSALLIHAQGVKTLSVLDSERKVDASASPAPTEKTLENTKSESCTSPENSIDNDADISGSFGRKVNKIWNDSWKDAKKFVVFVERAIGKNNHQSLRENVPSPLQSVLKESNATPSTSSYTSHITKPTNEVSATNVGIQADLILEDTKNKKQSLETPVLSPSVSASIPPPPPPLPPPPTKRNDKTTPASSNLQPITKPVNIVPKTNQKQNGMLDELNAAIEKRKPRESASDNENRPTTREYSDSSLIQIDRNLRDRNNSERPLKTRLLSPSVCAPPPLPPPANEKNETIVGSSNPQPITKPVNIVPKTNQKGNGMLDELNAAIKKRNLIETSSDNQNRPTTSESSDCRQIPGDTNLSHKTNQGKRLETSVLSLSTPPRPPLNRTNGTTTGFANPSHMNKSANIPSVAKQTKKTVANDELKAQLKKRQSTENGFDKEDQPNTRESSHFTQISLSTSLNKEKDSVSVSTPPPPPPPPSFSEASGANLVSSNTKDAAKVTGKSGVDNQKREITPHDQLMEQIQAGVQLKKAPKNNPKKEETLHDQLMEQIQSGVQLKKVTEKDRIKPSSSPEGSVAEILKRRVAMNISESEDSEDSDSDSDGWDDQESTTKRSSNMPGSGQKSDEKTKTRANSGTPDSGQGSDEEGITKQSGELE